MQSGVTPFATRAQLYSLLADRTLADRQLEALRRTAAVRLVQLPASRGECAVVLAEDYADAVQRCKAEAQAEKQGQQGEAGGGVRPGAAAAAPDSDVFDWFLGRVLPSCTELMITHGELVQLLVPSPTGDG